MLEHGYQFAFKMSLINLAMRERIPLGKHPELTLKATRSVFATSVALSVSSRMP